MFPLAAFHHLASGCKDGLLPEFADLLEGHENAIETSSNVARLESYRETFLSQAGPNPKGTAEGLDDKKIVAFRKQSAIRSTKGK